MTIAGAVLATLVAAGIIAAARAAAKVFKRKKEGKATDPAATYPVRLTCREHEEFHPSSGYQDGVILEVFNHSNKPVSVKGFGFKITMQDHHQEWPDYELARHFPPHEFPIRLAPNDGLEGYIQAEALAEDLYERGEADFVQGNWVPYVEVIGYGEMTGKIEPQ